MIGDVVVGSAEKARDWFDYLSFFVTILGVYIVARYTRYTRRLVDLTNDSLDAAKESSAKALEQARESLKAANDSSALALEQTRASNDATKKSNEIAERSLLLGRRAWLTIRSLRAYRREPSFKEHDVGKTAEHQLSVFIANVGGVPTSALMASFFLSRSTGAIPDGSFILAVSEAHRAIGPGEDYEVLSRHTISDVHAEALAEGERWIAQCTIKYSDLFGQDWVSSAAWECYEGLYGDWIPIPKHYIMS